MLDARPLFLALAACLTGPLGAQTTWIVDDDGGAGVDFVDLPPAVAAAGPLDLIVVREGDYSATTLTGPARILGQDAVRPRVHGSLTIRDLPDLRTALVAEIEIVGALEVGNCDGTVVLEDVDARVFSIDASFDVRMHRFTVPFASTSGPTNVCIGSRLEFVQSELSGGWGEARGCNEEPDHGSTALQIEASKLHHARSRSTGGWGGNCIPAGVDCCFNIAFGGAAIWGLDSELVLTGLGGPNSSVRSGPGGLGLSTNGQLGPGLLLFASTPGAALIRSSNVEYSGMPEQRLGAGVRVLPASDDPLLLLAGPAIAGQSLALDVHGAPGSLVELEFGRNPATNPVQGSPIERLTTAERAASLGTIPPGGKLSIPISVPALWPAGTLFFLQARVIDPATGAVRMTNSAPILVR